MQISRHRLHTGNDDTVAVVGVILGLHRGYIGVI